MSSKTKKLTYKNSYEADEYTWEQVSPFQTIKSGTEEDTRKEYEIATNSQWTIDGPEYRKNSSSAFSKVGVAIDMDYLLLNKDIGNYLVTANDSTWGDDAGTGIKIMTYDPSTGTTVNKDFNEIARSDYEDTGSGVYKKVGDTAPLDSPSSRLFSKLEELNNATGDTPCDQIKETAQDIFEELMEDLSLNPDGPGQSLNILTTANGSKFYFGRIKATPVIDVGGVIKPAIKESDGSYSEILPTSDWKHIDELSITLSDAAITAIEAISTETLDLTCSIGQTDCTGTPFATKHNKGFVLRWCGPCDDSPESDPYYHNSDGYATVDNSTDTITEGSSSPAGLLKF